MEMLGKVTNVLKITKGKGDSKKNDGGSDQSQPSQKKERKNLNNEVNALSNMMQNQTKKKEKQSAGLGSPAHVSELNDAQNKAGKKPQGKKDLINRQDFQVQIIKNSYEDILFYEKKALNLEKIDQFLNQQAFNIDMQMNLSEFLYKIKPAAINDGDLKKDKNVQRQQQLAIPPLVKLDDYRIRIGGWSQDGEETVTVNLFAATALIEETMSLLERCKYFQAELDKRDLIIQKAILNTG